MRSPVVVFHLREPAQRVIPVPLQRIRDQAVLGSDGKKLALRELGVLTRARRLRATRAIEIGLAGAELVEHLVRHRPRRA